MSKVSLKLSEILALDSELTGLVNQSTGERLTKGLLSQSLNLKTKFWLTKLKDQTAVHAGTVEQLKRDTIKKYGKEDDKGNIVIPLKGENESEINPDYISFINEMNELLAEEKEIEYKPLSLEDFNFETDEVYPTFFKLLSEKSEN
jgi:hypothetical protein